MLHQRGYSGELAVVQRDAEIARGHLAQDALKQREQSVHVAQAVREDPLALFRRERPAPHDAVACGVFLLRADRIEVEVAQGAEQAFAFGRR